MRTWLILALLAPAFVLAGSEPPNVILLPYSTVPATLRDCDRAWQSQRQSIPRAGIVVNLTLCEPYRRCDYGTQLYKRMCYRPPY